MQDESEKIHASLSDDADLKKLQVRKLEFEALKLEAEAEKLKAETRSSNPRFMVIKFAFAGLVAGISCFLLVNKVMTDLFSLAKSRNDEASKMLVDAKAQLTEAESKTDELIKQQTELAVRVETQKSEIAAAELEKKALADANAGLKEQFAATEKTMTQMKEEIQLKSQEVNLTTQQKKKLEEQEKILAQALENARRSIPQRASETLGYLRIGQLDPRGYFISGKSAIAGNPSFDELKIGQEYVATTNYNVRVALPRNDTLYHEGVVAVDLIAGGEPFVITEGPTVYFRAEDRDVWVGVNRPALALRPARGAPISSEAATEAGTETMGASATADE